MIKAIKTYAFSEVLVIISQCRTAYPYHTHFFYLRLGVSANAAIVDL
jgi:hypothetical protein